MTKRPPKNWFDKCLSRVDTAYGIRDAGAVCGYIWHHVLKSKTKKKLLKGE